MASDNLAAVRRFVEECWNKGNLTMLGEVVADRYVGHDPIVGELRGSAALKEHIETLRTGFPDLVVKIEDIGMSADRVWVRWTARGTHRGAYLGVPPTNRSIEIRGMSVHRMTAGKCAEEHMTYDSLAVLQGLGVLPPLDRLMKQSGAPGATLRM